MGWFGSGKKSEKKTGVCETCKKKFSASESYIKTYGYSCIKCWLRPEKLKKAKKHEEFLEFEEAAEIYKEYGMDDDVIRVRDEARNKVSQTVVHGDYVDDRDTIVKDSVVNRSNIGGNSKAEGLREAKSLFEEGLIDESEYKQMKKEILCK